MIEFAMLGPLEVRRDGTTLRLGGPKQRLLLGALLVEPKRVVAGARLIELIWGSDPPATASNVLQQYISQLRRLLEPVNGGPSGARMLVSQAPGYRLNVDPDQIDAARFEQLITTARKATAGGDDGAALGLHREAEALWRGVVLADLGDEPVAVRERGRLDELRLGAVEDQFEIRLRLRQHAEIAAEIEVVASDHPLRERMQGQLMLALYRCGRQADASAVYYRTRERLVEETGMEPGPDLQRLLKEIVRQEIAVPAPSAPEPRAPSEPSDLRTLCPLLIGRDAELSVLEAALVASRRRQGRLVLIAGEAGVGKSRLVTELRRRAGQGGLTVLAGGCSQGASLPYLPFLEASANYLDSVDVAQFRERLGRSADGLAVVLPQLAEESLADQADPVSGKLRLYEAMVALLRVAAGDGSLLLVLEDLHWADSSTRELLDYVARRVRGLPVMVLATYRSDELHRRHPLGPIVQQWCRAGTAQLVTVETLLPEQVGEMVCAILSESELSKDFQTYLHDRSRGNPFVLEEMLKEAIDRGDVYRIADRWERKEITEFSLPRAVADAILMRVERLDVAEIAVLQAAAILGRTFSYVTLAAITDMSKPAIQSALEICVINQLIEPDVQVSGRFRFRHALTQEAVHDGIIAPRRQELHLQAAEALREALAPTAEVAHHLDLGGRPADAAPLFLDAADEALRRFAPSDVVAHLQRALPHIAAPAERGAVMARIGEALWRLGDLRSAERYLADAIHLLEGEGDATTAAHARLVRGRCLWELGQDKEAYAQYDIVKETLEPLGPSEDLALLYLRLVLRCNVEWDGEGAIRMAEKAISVASAVESEPLRIWGGMYLGNSLCQLDRVDEGLTAMDESMRAATARELHWIAKNALGNGLNVRCVCLRTSEIPQLLDHYRSMPGYARSDEVIALGYESYYHLVHGNLYDAERLFKLSSEIARDTGQYSAAIDLNAMRTWLLIERDELGEARATVQSVDAVENKEAKDQTAWVSMMLELAAGAPAAAAALAESVLDDDRAGVGASLSDTALEAFLAAGRYDDAHRLLDDPRQFRTPREPFGQLAQGRLALATGQVSDAVTHLTLVRNQFGASGERLRELRTQLLLARALAATGSTSEARSLIEAALGEAEPKGLRLLVRLAWETAGDLHLTLPSSNRLRR